MLAVARDPLRLAAVTEAADAVAAEAGATDRRLRARHRDSCGAARAAAAATAAAVRRDVSARSAAFASRHAASAIAGLAAEHDVDLVVLDCGAIPAGGRLAGDVLAVLEQTTADVALLIGAPPTGRGADRLPVRWRESRLGSRRAGGPDCPRPGDGLRLIGIATDDDDASRLVARAALALQHAIGLNAEPGWRNPAPRV